MITKKQIQTALQNIYISPLEGCNLNCRLCYTKKHKKVLSNPEILKFVEKYRRQVNLKSILFCGGEVFKLPHFPQLINQLIAKNIFISIITNGTIDRLSEIKNPQNCQVLVSLDGPKQIHDQNRGAGNFEKSLNFIKKAQTLNFPVEIMFLITPQSYPHRDTFPKSVNSLLRHSVNFSYVTQKTSFYTQNHPLSVNLNQKGLSVKQIIEIKKNYSSIPSKKFGCFQLSLQSNGLLYGCCESPSPIGEISDPAKILIENFNKFLKICQKCPEKHCLGCCQPDFLCGYTKELNKINCQQVIKSFQ